MDRCAPLEHGRSRRTFDAPTSQAGTSGEHAYQRSGLYLPKSSSLNHKPLVFSGSIWFSGSRPLVSLTASKAGRPPYSCPPPPPAPFTRVPPPPSSSCETLIGWLPLKRLRMSTNPRLHCPRPRFSCWHRVGRVSRSGGVRHSTGVCRSTRIHSLFCRQSARAARISLQDEGIAEERTIVQEQ